MAVLGTSYETGGDFYGRKARQTGEALRMFVDSLHQRRQEKEQREQEEIANAFSSIQSAPELADTLGRDIERKYGAKHPEVPQLLAVIRERHRLQQEVPQAGKRFEDLWGQKEADYAAQQENVARMPATVEAPLPFNPFGLPAGTLKLPNPNKAAAERALSQVRPELFPRDAWLSMTPRERMAVLPYMKNKGYELPEQTPFDPFGGDLTPKAAGAEAIRRGYIPEESLSGRVIKGEGELELTEAEKKKQEFQTKEREARESAETKNREESDRLQRERMNLEDDLRAAAQRRQVSGQKEIINYRQSKKGGDGGGKDDLAVPWKAVVSDSKSAVEDYDKRKAEAIKGLEGTSRSDAEDAFVKANGKRPPVIGEVAARRLAREVRTRKLAGAEADEALIEMSSAYMTERARGTGEEEALKRATGKSKAPDPAAAKRAKRAQMADAAAFAATQQGEAAPDKTKPNQPAAQKPLFSEIKDERWRAFAVKEYADQIATGVSPDVAKQFVDDLLRSKGQIK